MAPKRRAQGTPLAGPGVERAGPPGAGPELLHDGLALLLRHVPVHGRDREVGFSHLLCQPVDLHVKPGHAAVSSETKPDGVFWILLQSSKQNLVYGEHRAQVLLKLGPTFARRAERCTFPSTVRAKLLLFVPCKFLKGKERPSLTVLV